MLSKITEKTLISLNLIPMVVGLVVWNIRLSDKVERNDGMVKEIMELRNELVAVRNELKFRVFRLEEKTNTKHPDSGY